MSRPKVKTTESVNRVRRRTRKGVVTMSALEHALACARLGIKVIWIPRGSKAPILKGWPGLATLDADIIRKWDVDHPGCNFGLIMGNGFVAIDIDGPEGLAAIQSRGLPLPSTRAQITPGGGLHFIYRLPEGLKISNHVGLLPKVDIKGEAGQIVCAGSIHPNGGRYELYE